MKLHEGKNPYIKCPVYETEHFILRLVKESDADYLLKCYSDSIAQTLFNIDNCTDSFCFNTIDEMKECIRFWLKEYEDEAYVRFAIVDKELNKAVGTIEMFGNVGKYKTDTGILRIDISSLYENKKCLEEIFSACVLNFYDLFEVNNILTKAIPLASERIDVLLKMGFVEYNDNEREHYYICAPKSSF